MTKNHDQGTRPSIRIKDDDQGPGLPATPPTPLKRSRQNVHSAPVPACSTLCTSLSVDIVYSGAPFWTAPIPAAAGYTLPTHSRNRRRLLFLLPCTIPAPILVRSVRSPERVPCTPCKPPGIKLFIGWWRRPD